MRSARKEYKDKLEKEIRREYKEWKRLPSARWGMRTSAGEYVELEKPIQDGYDLVLRVDLKESDARKKVLEECYSELYTPIHSSGIEFRKCDCRKSMFWNPSYPTFLEHRELDYFFTKNKLDFAKVKYCVREKICDSVYEKLSSDAKKYFTKCESSTHHVNHLKRIPSYKYKFFDEDHIPFHFEIRPHYITHQFVPNNEIISRSDFLSTRLWDDRLWFTELSEGDNYAHKNRKVRKMERKAKDRKIIKTALKEYDGELYGN